MFLCQIIICFLCHLHKSFNTCSYLFHVGVIYLVFYYIFIKETFIIEVTAKEKELHIAVRSASHTHISFYTVTLEF